MDLEMDENTAADERSTMTVQAAAELLATPVPSPAYSCPVCGTPLGWWKPEKVAQHAEYHRAVAAVAAAVARGQHEAVDERCALDDCEPCEACGASGRALVVAGEAGWFDLADHRHGPSGCLVMTWRRHTAQRCRTARDELLARAVAARSVLLDADAGLAEHLRETP